MEGNENWKLKNLVDSSQQQTIQRWCVPNNLNEIDAQNNRKQYAVCYQMDFR